MWKCFEKELLNSRSWITPLHQHSLWDSQLYSNISFTCICILSLCKLFVDRCLLLIIISRHSKTLSWWSINFKWHLAKPCQNPLFYFYSLFAPSDVIITVGYHLNKVILTHFGGANICLNLPHFFVFSLSKFQGSHNLYANKTDLRLTVIYYFTTMIRIPDILFVCHKMPWCCLKS